MPTEQKVQEILRRFRSESWEERTGRGSHVVFRKNGVTISVPTPKGEVALGTYPHIAKDAGWD